MAGVGDRDEGAAQERRGAVIARAPKGPAATGTTVTTCPIWVRARAACSPADPFQPPPTATATRRGPAVWKPAATAARRPPASAAKSSGVPWRSTIQRCSNCRICPPRAAGTTSPYAVSNDADGWARTPGGRFTAIVMAVLLSRAYAR